MTFIPIGLITHAGSLYSAIVVATQKIHGVALVLFLKDRVIVGIDGPSQFRSHKQCPGHPRGADFRLNEGHLGTGIMNRVGLAFHLDWRKLKDRPLTCFFYSMIVPVSIDVFGHIFLPTDVNLRTPAVRC